MVSKLLQLHGSLNQRAFAKELIDDTVDDAHLLAESFADMERANRYFGGIAPIRDAVLRRKPRTMLDVGCGTAELARVITLACRKAGHPLQVTCVDSSGAILALAREKNRDLPELTFAEARGESLPFAEQAFEVATCTLTLHHCDPPEAVILLRELKRIARYPMVADLHRCLPGLMGAYFFSRMLSRNTLTRHDAPLSVRRAYTVEEARDLAVQAGWKMPRVRITPFFRMLITDEM